MNGEYLEAGLTGQVLCEEAIANVCLMVMIGDGHPEDLMLMSTSSLLTEGSIEGRGEEWLSHG